MTEHDDYRQTLLSQFQELGARLNRLSEQFDRLDGAARVEARKQLQALRAQCGEALARLQTWDEVKQGPDKAWYERAGDVDASAGR